MHTVVEAVLGSLFLAYYAFKAFRRLFSDFGRIIMSRLQRRSQSRTVIHTNDGATVAITGPSAEEIERLLRQVESQPPQKPESEREEENPSG